MLFHVKDIMRSKKEGAALFFDTTISTKKSPSVSISSAPTAPQSSLSDAVPQPPD